MARYLTVKVCLLVSAFVLASALKCWECNDAEGEGECQRIGKLSECRPNQDACQVEVRIHEGWNFTQRITKRCKQKLACENNEIQNEQGAWYPTQCNPAFPANSVCRCCCFNDECNVNQTDCFGKMERPTQMKAMRTCQHLNSPIYGSVDCHGSADNMTCKFSCQGGYRLEGKEVLKCEFGDGWTETEPICISNICQQRSNFIQFGSSSCSNGNIVGSICSYKCEANYEVEGSSTSNCEQNSEWSHPVPKCNKKIAYCSVAPTDGYKSVICTKENMVGSRCSYQCQDNMRLLGTNMIACMDNLSWDRQPPKCVSTKCSRRHDKPVPNGKVICSNENKVNSECTYICNNGYELLEQETAKCMDNGQWSYGVPKCQAQQCGPAHTNPDNGQFTCDREDDAVGTKCVFTCDEGYTLIGSKTSSCKPNLNFLPAWSSPAPRCEKIFCPTIAIDHGQAECSMGINYNSVCAFKCDKGYLPDRDDVELVCQIENFSDNVGTWSDAPPRCQPIKCPEIQLANGMANCDNENFIGSKCEFACEEQFDLIGSSSVTCEQTSENVGLWNDAVPTCDAMGCPEIEIENGFVICSDENKVGTRCDFFCVDFYELQGALTASCMAPSSGNMQWDQLAPTCQPLSCETQEIKHGEAVCSNDNFITSECEFKCTEEDFVVYPEGYGTTTCLNSTDWDKPKPCCAIQCPPFAYMDLVIVLDSSSSIQTTNWYKMISFVQDIVSTFVVNEGAAHFGIFRYNKRIDKKTQIFLNSYDDVYSIIEGISKIPYDGSGTSTGQALDHTSEVMLSEKNGNRPFARDIVLMITDGKSQDNVAEPARRLREAGVAIYVLAINQGGIDLGQVKDIAGPEHDDRIIVTGLDEGFDALTDQFSASLSKIFCGDPCAAEE